MAKLNAEEYKTFENIKHIREDGKDFKEGCRYAKT
jgi:hypothetical protein